MINLETIGPVDVSQWPTDEDNPVFPVGSKPKKLLICPDHPPFDWLIPGHRYLFKNAEGWQAGQLWTEVFAWHFSLVVGVDVPRCFVGVDGRGILGAVIEFFFAYPGEATPERFVHASDLLQRSLIDKKRGRPHSVRSNAEICRALQIADARNWWAKTLVFDALIGNTDRHPDNWGILAKVDAQNNRSFRLAPDFDNGTSLAYERTEESLAGSWDDARLGAYIDRGKHHCSWARSNDTPEGHISLCRLFRETYPETGQTMKNMIRFEMIRVNEILTALSQVKCAHPFTLTRAQFVERLIEGRQKRLAEALGI
ncbi:MAG TPA: HipA domain-containing protein [Xanthobacteraceae bacterium]|nr:HipA domain-containing protein [Xanthobacteraceae bacterium]